MLLDHIVETTLSNGLKIICLPKKGAPVAALQLWYKTGSRAETEGQRGISHFLEHMMFRGSAAVLPEEHARRVNDVGGHCNAFTAEDATAYINSVPQEHLEQVIELEADRMDHLNLDEKLFEIERKVIIEEYHTYMNNPVAKAFLEFRSEFYGAGHPYATSPLGRSEDIAAVTTAQCREYYRAHYAPDNAVAVVAGDVDQRAVFDAVARHFENKPRRGTVPPPLAEIPRSTPAAAKRMNRRVEFDVPLMVMGYPAPPSTHADAAALEILQIVLAGGETGRLHREVVRRQSLAVMAGGMNHLLKSSGMSIFFAAFTPDIGAERVERAVAGEIARVRDQGVTPEELEKVRNVTLASRTFELYTADHLCQRLGYGEVLEGDYRRWVDRLESLKSLTVERLREVAGRWWNDSARHVLYLTPRRANPLLFVAGYARRIALAGRRIGDKIKAAGGKS